MRTAVGLLVLAALAGFAGCAQATKRSRPASGSERDARQAPASDAVARKAEELLASGAAADMAMALQMARDYFWPAFEDSTRPGIQPTGTKTQGAGGTLKW